MPRHEGETHRMTTSMATHVTADSPSTRHSLQVRFDAFELDEANARLRRDGRAVPLAPTPFALLCALTAIITTFYLSWDPGANGSARLGF